MLFKKGCVYGDYYVVGQDHLGGTSGTLYFGTDPLSTMTYEPFGATRSSSGTIPTDKLFTGQRLDGTGLYFYNARYYDPVIGRFISADTIVQSAPLPYGSIIQPLVVSPLPVRRLAGIGETRSLIGMKADPQELNRYSYVLNNPLRYTDPTGTQVDPRAVAQALQSNPYTAWLGALILAGYAAYEVQQSGALDGVGDALSSAGAKIKDALGKIGSAIGGLFGGGSKDCLEEAPTRETGQRRVTMAKVAEAPSFRRQSKWLTTSRITAGMRPKAIRVVAYLRIMRVCCRRE